MNKNIFIATFFALMFTVPNSFASFYHAELLKSKSHGNPHYVLMLGDIHRSQNKAFHVAKEQTQELIDLAKKENAFCIVEDRASKMNNGYCSDIIEIKGTTALLSDSCCPLSGLQTRCEYEGIRVKNIEFRVYEPPFSWGIGSYLTVWKNYIENVESRYQLCRDNVLNTNDKLLNNYENWLFSIGFGVVVQTMKEYLLRELKKDNTIRQPMCNIKDASGYLIKYAEQQKNLDFLKSIIILSMHNLSIFDLDCALIDFEILLSIADNYDKRLTIVCVGSSHCNNVIKRLHDAGYETLYEEGNKNFSSNNLPLDMAQISSEIRLRLATHDKLYRHSSVCILKNDCPLKKLDFNLSKLLNSKY